MMSERRFFEVSPERAGAYHSISKALEAIDESCPNDGRPVTIHIEPGEYRERVEIHRSHVTIEGETADSVRIVGSLGAKMPSEDGSGVDGTLGTFRTYTVLVDADDVRLENLTIENDAGDGREVGQAIALYADGDRLVVDACCIKGHQDTLFWVRCRRMRPNRAGSQDPNSMRRAGWDASIFDVAGSRAMSTLSLAARVPTLRGARFARSTAIWMSTGM